MEPHTSSALPSSLSPPSAGAPPAFPAGGGGGDVPFPVSGSAGQQKLAISNGVLLAAVIFLFMVVVFVFLLYLYAKRYLGANPLLARGASSPSSSRFIFVAASPLPQRGLPAAVLRSLPVTVYETKEAGEAGAEPLECAVCLSEVAGGEKVRALPKCGHGFHVECIDMWFHSHDTCPLCRAPVRAAPELEALPREDPAADAFPANVLFWGTRDDVANSDLSVVPPPQQTVGASASSSSSSSAAAAAAARGREENLVIDIPTRGVGPLHMTSPLPASRMPGFSAEEMRSPVSARLRSLRRLLSRGKQAVVGTSYSPRAAAGDIEQGLSSAGDPAARPPPPPPKTPKTPPSGN